MQSPERTLIKPSNRWIRPDLKGIWEYRELLFFLTLRDIKIKYKQTAIGIAWVVLQPVLTTAIFTIIFSAFARFDTGAVPYPVFVLSGLLIWLFVHTAISMASTSFVNNPNLVTKVYFPRLVVPIAATLAGLFDLIFGIALLVLLMIYYGLSISATILFAPLFLFLAVILAASFGTLFSALNVRFRDVKFALPFLLQVWMIASPIFYPSTLLTEKWRLVFAINPLTGILQGFRSSLVGGAFDWPAITVSTLSLVFLALFSLFVFKKMEDDFADII